MIGFSVDEGDAKACAIDLPSSVDLGSSCAWTILDPNRVIRGFSVCTN